MLGAMGEPVEPEVGALVAAAGAPSGVATVRLEPMPSNVDETCAKPNASSIRSIINFNTKQRIDNDSVEMYTF